CVRYMVSGGRLDVW
nr:immunoglobulin heavy chain junction region [Macaca mulatta]